MKYFLKNKDEIVLEFETIETKEILSNDEIIYVDMGEIKISNDNLPLGINKDNLKSSLTEWIERRKIPQNRKFYNKIMQSLQSKYANESFMGYIDTSLGLSLNDSYWIVPADKNYQWEKYNLYKNALNKNLMITAISGHSAKINDLSPSPEYTTNGMLAKCWYKDDANIYLYKSSSTKDPDEYGGKEAFSEFYMAQVAEIMKLNYVPYDLKEFHGKIVSSCPIFTNEDEGYMPIHYFLDKETIKKKTPENIEKIMNFYGKEAFEDLMVFDALICNTDRHLGNFGMIIDNNTNEILRPAPIFDNGLSILSLVEKEELKNYENYNNVGKTFTSYFGLKLNQQLEKYIQNRHLQGLEKLLNFNFKRHESIKLNDEWLDFLDNFIKQRAKLAIETLEKKHNKLIGYTSVSQIFNPNDSSALNEIKAEEQALQKQESLKLNEKQDNELKSRRMR